MHEPSRHVASQSEIPKEGVKETEMSVEADSEQQITCLIFKEVRKVNISTLLWGVLIPHIGIWMSKENLSGHKHLKTKRFSRVALNSHHNAC